MMTMGPATVKALVSQRCGERLQDHDARRAFQDDTRRTTCPECPTRRARDRTCRLHSADGYPDAVATGSPQPRVRKCSSNGGVDEGRAECSRLAFPTSRS